ncbi:hypothetical protein ABT124_34440 [Streptomyces sp. NPDC001982]|uniref:hypothetical protein n=1 Tax=Streptomyces sp. NPDC001982 TaxID=3154405 RepID=UPI003333D680
MAAGRESGPGRPGSSPSRTPRRRKAVDIPPDDPEVFAPRAGDDAHSTRLWNTPLG